MIRGDGGTIMKAKLAVIGMVLILASQCLGQGHTFVEFDPPGSVSTVAIAINSSGQIAGYYEDSASTVHGFLRDTSGSITTFDVPGAATGNGTGTGTQALNDAGEIVGYYNPSAAPTENEGFTRDASGNFTVVQVAGYTTTQVFSVNNGGQIAGCTTQTDYCSSDASSGTVGFVTNLSGDAVTFSPSGADAVIPLSINKGGSVAGFYSATDGSHGFVRGPGGGITEFDPPNTFSEPGAGAYPFAINDSGLVVGYYWDNAIPYQIRGFSRTARGVITAFDAPGTTPDTYPTSVNAAGTIVGWFVVPGAQYGKWGAFVREPSGTITEFEAPGADVQKNGTIAYSINAAGQIAGSYYDSAGILHGFLRN
jgi:predicted membrane protein